MIELIRTFETDSGQLDAVGPFIRTNPADVKGLSFSPLNRFLFFYKEGKSLYIDFEEQEISPSLVYLVPAYHFCYLDPDYDDPFVVIGTSEQSTGSVLRRGLYALKYKLNKSLPLLFPESSKGIHVLTEEQDLSADQAGKWLSACVNRAIGADSQTPYYVNCAERFLRILNSTRLSHRISTPVYFSDRLALHERTLRRVCLAIFGYSTAHIIRYHMVCKSHFLLTQSFSISEVADQLGFSDLAAYSRYLKGYTGNSPKILKQSMLSLFGDNTSLN